ncbi:adenine deaminase C-terminal domain-containing protein [Halalkalicoccus sp. NIPERK01]|uniref:adenine deaminase C-terminal domain-containing protein n=1 Tax=Halalkalicoccus sp. NIPERK01 TaxID=3053469 RepID=UPI00256F1AD3|nr:adenine deaminase C-terminal domain-containing protein [Halalkalicoccus sp. NIPERK01]MDL5361465.1 adenine deaminase C-terminal domain-containing protein [Halalkalicoccus sp. NIPERK01]
MNDLQPVALGDRPADLVVEGGRVLLPELGEFRSRAVAVVNNRVAALPEDADRVIGPETEVIHADSGAVVPGFVDAHTHLDMLQCYELAYHRSLEGGTTTVISECTALCAFGPRGVEEFLAATAYLPVTVAVALPPTPLFDTFEPADATGEEARELVDLLADDRIVGVGETDWIHAVGRDTPAEALYERAGDLGKPVTGHAAGCRGGKLAAFASIVDNDHEAIDRGGVIERAENGIHVVGRCGSVRDDVEALAEAIDRVGPAECSLSTDGVWPRDLPQGHMDRVVRRAIEAGIDPTDALRMATLSPARHFGLDDRGSLAPGNVADVVVLSDLEGVRVETVVSGGEVVVRNGTATVGPRNREYPEEFYDSVSIPTDPGAFSVPADGEAVRAITLEGGLLTGETRVSPPVEGGEFRPDPEGDVLKAALHDRRADRRRGFTGFLTGLGLQSGAVAASSTWELPGVVVVGADETEMARAAARVEEMGGGWAVADGEVVAELPLRVGATCSDLDVGETATLFGTVESALRARGVGIDRPLLAIQTLSFPGVPALKLSFSGYADVKERELVGLQ